MSDRRNRPKREKMRRKRLRSKARARHEVHRVEKQNRRSQRPRWHLNQEV